MMRIITGRARGTHLTTLEGVATRPTAERTKEAVFSVIAFEIPDATVLDLFAGSGQLGLEALSRGAKRAVFCDRSADAVRVIRANAEKTRLLPSCEILCLDAEAALGRLKGRERFDIVFLDPPYAAHLVPRALTLLDELDLLSPTARIICETAEEGDVFDGNAALSSRFSVARTARYGAAYVTILTPHAD